jgi:hypothetical protein
MSRTAATNWDEYYSRQYRTASITRKFTERALIDAMVRHSGSTPTVIELGGANSCFWEGINAAVRPQSYTAVDNNALGLGKLAARAEHAAGLRAVRADIFALPPLPPADIVFSVGLVEHFTPERTLAAIDAHFHLAKGGGLVIVTFPTPTWLYRATRLASEQLGMWLFHDERPFWYSEVARTFEANGAVIQHRILWPIVLTQTLVIARKRGSPLNG